MMSAKAVVCPHCGRRQSDRDPVPQAREAGPFRSAQKSTGGQSSGPQAGDDEGAGEAPPARPKLELSPEETRALFATQGVAAADDRPRGLASVLVPRPDASPLARGLEGILTVVALPMLVAGLVPLMLSPRTRAVIHESEAIVSAAAAIAGGLAIWSLGPLMGWGPNATYAVIGLGAGAIVGRLFVRSRMT